MKIIITEQQNEKLNKKIRLAVGKLGLVQAREMFGDFSNSLDGTNLGTTSI